MDERDTEHPGDPSTTPPTPDVPAPLTAPISLRHTARLVGWRTVLAALGVAVLIVTLVSGSVVAARRMSGVTRLAPESSLNTTVTSEAQTQEAGAIVRGAVTNCNCSSKHGSYAAPPVLPYGSGQVVIVSLSKQQLWAYQNSQLFMTALVTTGMPQLPTPTGTYHIMMKEANVWFYSPWPYGSPYYYTPEFVPFAMLFRDGGFYIHAAPWRETFGPGTNVPHTEPDGTTATGSHGCVNMSTSTAGQLYYWIGIGATVVIQN